MLGMKPQRESSKAYLREILGQEARFCDVWTHFTSFAQSLITRLVAGRQKNARLIFPTGHGEEFMTLVKSGAQVIYGTFHVGCSDLMGFALADGYCPISMIRLKVGNSHDVERFSKHYNGLGLNLIWVNEPRDVILGINNAIKRGDSIAMQCDRVDHVARSESFRFLGAKRIFPFTIYHLSALYSLPVAFCFRDKKRGAAKGPRTLPTSVDRG
jgi:predicted LPLAT superfamily acyltransferase